MRNPFLITGPAVLSVSFGRSSMRMLRGVLDAHGGRLPPDVHALFTNTGEEAPGTLDFGDECASRWDVDITWAERRRHAPGRFVEVTYETASRAGEPFDELIDERRAVPNAFMRFCTQELKIEVMRRYMRAQGYTHWTNVVGLRADEARRVASLRAHPEDEWDIACPLYDAGVTKADVVAFWKAQPFDLGIEPWDGNCTDCFLKSVAQRYRRAEDHPEVTARWAAREVRTGRTFRKGETYAQLLADTKAQLRLHLRTVVEEEGESLHCACTEKRPSVCDCRRRRGNPHYDNCALAQRYVAAMRAWNRGAGPRPRRVDVSALAWFATEAA